MFLNKKFIFAMIYVLKLDFHFKNQQLFTKKFLIIIFSHKMNKNFKYFKINITCILQK
jgi:hypothetical protein